MNKLIAFLVMAGLATTPWCVGVPVVMVNLTFSAGLFALAAMLTAVNRLSNGFALFPVEALKQPAVWSALFYFGIGLLTYFAADDKIAFTKEVVQRTTIIWIPMYCTAMGLRTVNQAKSVLLWYLPAGCFLSVISAGAAISGGFAAPAYVMGLHKNMTAGLSATMCVIGIAHLLTSKRAKITLGWLKLPNKPLMIAVVALGLLSIVAAQGRAGLVEVVCGTFCILVAVRAKPTTVLKFVAICVCVVLFIYKLLPEKAIEHVVSNEQHSANAIRIMIWSEMFNNFVHRPFMLVGWGNPFVDARGYYYYDLACVLFFDWMQMSIVGAIALLVMIFFSIKLGFDNAKLINPNSAEGFVNAAALGVIAGKFAHGMLDTFWIGRGHTLHVWPCIGICLFMFLLNRQKMTQAEKQQRNKSMAVVSV